MLFTALKNRKYDNNVFAQLQEKSEVVLHFIIKKFYPANVCVPDKMGRNCSGNPA